MSELLCRNSTAQATRSPCARGAPARSEARSASAGRSRLPPGKTAYPSASLSRLAPASELAGSAPRSAHSTAGLSRATKPRKSSDRTFTVLIIIIR